jgi:hypothetical protein
MLVRVKIKKVLGCVAVVSESDSSATGLGYCWLLSANWSHLRLEDQILDHFVAMRRCAMLLR